MKFLKKYGGKCELTYRAFSQQSELEGNYKSVAIVQPGN